MELEEEGQYGIIESKNNDDYEFFSLQKNTKLTKLDGCWSELDGCGSDNTLFLDKATLNTRNFHGCRFLTCLPELPASLTRLDCHNCPLLTCLPELPDTLIKLTCQLCPLLTALPNLPATLTMLDCSYCPLLTALPELPATLKYLHCSQEYFIDKYDYKIDSSNIERFRNDPITIKRRERKTC